MRRDHYRAHLLDLPFDQPFDWEAKVLDLKGDRLTLSQLRKIGEPKVYATHLNFSMNKLRCSPKDQLRKGVAVYFSARPSAYIKNGVRRGSLAQDINDPIMLKFKKDEND